MGHVGVICPNTSGHVNPMLALADAIRTRGHRVTFFLVGSPPSSIAAAGFESVPLGGSVFPSNQYQAGFVRAAPLTLAPISRHEEKRHP